MPADASGSKAGTIEAAEVLEVCESEAALTSSGKRGARKWAGAGSAALQLSFAVQR